MTVRLSILQEVVLLRLRGFLHAFHLVEMTTGTNDLSRRFFGFFNPLNDSSGWGRYKVRYCFALGDLSTSLEMTVHFYHHNKIRHSGFYFHLSRKDFIHKVDFTRQGRISLRSHCFALGDNLSRRFFAYALNDSKVEYFTRGSTASP